jgi:antitoxin VapB
MTPDRRTPAVVIHGSPMYVDYVDINSTETQMPLQIANPVVVRKVEQLARAMGLSKTAAVERAVDRLLSETQPAGDAAERMASLLAQLDRVPERPDAFEPLEWDAQGLPR